MAGEKTGVVFIVDDDAGIRRSVGMLLKSVGIESAAFGNPTAFLNAPLDSAGCILLDVRMPEMSGIEVQRRLAAAGAAGAGVPA